MTKLKDPVPKRETVRIGELKQALDLSAVEVRALVGIHDTAAGASNARRFASLLPLPFPKPITAGTPLVWSRDALIDYRIMLAGLPPERQNMQGRHLLARMQSRAWANGIHAPAQFSPQQQRRIMEGDWRGSEKKD